MTESVDRPRLLMVVGLARDVSNELRLGDLEIKRRLESFGYHITVSSYQNVGESDGSSKDVIFISSSVGAPPDAKLFRDIDVPIVVADDKWLEFLGMVR